MLPADDRHFFDFCSLRVANELRFSDPQFTPSLSFVLCSSPHPEQACRADGYDVLSGETVSSPCAEDNNWRKIVSVGRGRTTNASYVRSTPIFSNIKIVISIRDWFKQVWAQESCGHSLGAFLKAGIRTTRGRIRGMVARMLCCVWVGISTIHQQNESTTPAVSRSVFHRWTRHAYIHRYCRYIHKIHT